MYNNFEPYITIYKVDIVLIYDLEINSVNALET